MGEQDLKLWAKRSIRRVSEPKAILRWTMIAGHAIEAFVAGKIGLDKSFESIQHDLEQLSNKESNILKSLFLPIDEKPWISTIPASAHPFRPLSDNEEWYQIEMQAAKAYGARFIPPDACIRLAKGIPHVRPSDSMAIFGSQVSNVWARRILGQPWNVPRLEAIGEKKDWQAHLRWNMHTPQDAPIRTIIEYREPWKSQGHLIISREGESLQSHYTRDNRQKDDYLLITRLPRYWSSSDSKSMMVILAGLHGAGTRASEMLLTNPPLDELTKLLKKTENAAFYQALFYVECENDKFGDTWPKKITLIDATEIEVEAANN